MHQRKNLIWKDFENLVKRAHLSLPHEADLNLVVVVLGSVREITLYRNEAKTL